MATENKLAGKLVKILGALGSLEKKGYNSHQKYYYMREVDVMEALKAQLIANKMIMLTSSRLKDIQKKEGKDKTDFVTTVETTHTFIDSETGEQLAIDSVGSGYDSSDKGASKAITAAIKYAIMKTFMISDEGADIENDGKTAQAPAITTPQIKTATVVKTDEPKAAATPNKLPTATVKAATVLPNKAAESAPVVAAPKFPKRVAAAQPTTPKTEPNFP